MPSGTESIADEEARGAAHYVAHHRDYRSPAPYAAEVHADTTPRRRGLGGRLLRVGAAKTRSALIAGQGALKFALCGKVPIIARQKGSLRDTHRLELREQRRLRFGGDDPLLVSNP